MPKTNTLLDRLEEYLNKTPQPSLPTVTLKRESTGYYKVSSLLSDEASAKSLSEAIEKFLGGKL